MPCIFVCAKLYCMYWILYAGLNVSDFIIGVMYILYKLPHLDSQSSM